MYQDYQEHRWAQLVVVDPDGRLLLCQQHQAQQLSAWTTAGAELLPEESFPESAMRALEALTGLSCPLGPLLKESEVVESAYVTRPVRHLERYFLVRSPYPGEHTPLPPTCQWWSIADMQSVPAETFTPIWLPNLLASVLLSEAIMPSSAARF